MTEQTQELHLCAVFLVLNDLGEYEVATDEDVALDRYATEIGDDRPRRVVKLALKVPAPRVQEVSATLPEAPDAGPVTVTVA